MSKKIVIIEDDQLLLKALKLEVGSSGYELLSALDGKKGLSMVKKEKPDLVLLDLLLPKMHGFEVLAELKKNATTKKIPVIVLTNFGQDQDKKKSLELGADDYCVKSATGLGVLMGKIKKILK